MTEKALIVGNGINRLSLKKEGYDWEELVDGVYAQYNLKQNESDGFKPLPLKFQEITYKILKKDDNFDDIETEVKNKVAEIVKSIEQNRYHKALLGLDIGHIITTNYDRNIFHESYVKDSVVNETKYSIFRSYSSKEYKPKIWFAHGEAKVPKSITLGFCR